MDERPTVRNVLIEGVGLPACQERIRCPPPVILDAKAEKYGQLRVVDESGASYLYPEDMFIDANLPQPVRRVVLPVA